MVLPVIRVCDPVPHPTRVHAEQFMNEIPARDVNAWQQRWWSCSRLWGHFPPTISRIGYSDKCRPGEHLWYLRLFGHTFYAVTRQRWVKNPLVPKGQVRRIKLGFRIRFDHVKGWI
jgi:hypothetical protein